MSDKQRKNVLLRKKNNDNQIDVLYPITHSDNVVVDNGSLSDKLQTLDNLIGDIDLSDYTKTLSDGIKVLFDSITSIMNVLTTSKQGNIFIRECTLKTDDWVKNSNSGMFEASVTSTYITEEDIINIYFDASSINEVDRCGIENYYCSNGKFIIESSTQPTTNITFKYTLIKEFINGYIPESFQFYNCTTSKLDDGSILKTYDFGTLLRTENSDGSVTEVFTDMDGHKTTKITKTDTNGNIVETVTN